MSALHPNDVHYVYLIRTLIGEEYTVHWVGCTHNLKHRVEHHRLDITNTTHDLFVDDAVEVVVHSEHPTWAAGLEKETQVSRTLRAYGHPLRNAADGVTPAFAMSTEQRRRIGDANRGRALTPAHKEAISIANTGRVIALEGRVNMSIAQRNRYTEHPEQWSWSDASKARASASHVGQVHTEESRMQRGVTRKMRQLAGGIDTMSMTQLRELLCAHGYSGPWTTPYLRKVSNFRDFAKEFIATHTAVSIN